MTFVQVWITYVRLVVQINRKQIRRYKNFIHNFIASKQIKTKCQNDEHRFDISQ